jgi:hypothetical protein
MGQLVLKPGVFHDLCQFEADSRVGTQHAWVERVASLGKKEGKAGGGERSNKAMGYLSIN